MCKACHGNSDSKPFFSGQIYRMHNITICVAENLKLKPPVALICYIWAILWGGVLIRKIQHQGLIHFSIYLHIPSGLQ